MPLADDDDILYQEIMSHEVDIEAILDRHREITKEIDQLVKERDELDLVLRVLKRFQVAPESNEAKLGPPRPEGTPTLYDMTVAVLKKAQASGRAGLTAREIVDEIGAWFWPGVQPPQILPQIYQFAKKGRLYKADGQIGLPIDVPQGKTAPTLAETLAENSKILGLLRGTDPQ